MLHKITNTFKRQFGREPLVFRSPGRVNIIGEHTDYNEGFVLPAAIDKNIYIAISKRDDEQIKLYAADSNETFSGDINNIIRSETQWANYILGVVDQLQKRGLSVGGFNAAIDGDIPIGAGLSSSAAVECATIFALNEIFKFGLGRMEMVPMAQKAEHVFALVNCGIMDQFASMLGKKDHVIKLDCRSLEYEYVPFRLEGYKIVLLNTNVKHNLASSQYNIRRQQCEQGVAIVKEHQPDVQSLRDITMNMLIQYVEPADQLIFKRCSYVVEENDRLLAGCEDLRRGDIRSLGQKMFKTHDGLSKLYDVSCKELDFLVAFTRNIAGVAGSRMMGGGFGGCTINLVEDHLIDELVSGASVAYEEAMGLQLTAYIASIEDGTSVAVKAN